MEGVCASDKGVGVVLTQQDHRIAYLSKALETGDKKVLENKVVDVLSWKQEDAVISTVSVSKPCWVEIVC
jgi:hypothetical protein